MTRSPGRLPLHFYHRHNPNLTTLRSHMPQRLLQTLLWDGPVNPVVESHKPSQLRSIPAVPAIISSLHILEALFKSRITYVSTRPPKTSQAKNFGTQPIAPAHHGLSMVRLVKSYHHFLHPHASCFYAYQQTTDRHVSPSLNYKNPLYKTIMALAHPKIKNIIFHFIYEGSEISRPLKIVSNHLFHFRTRSLSRLLRSTAGKEKPAPSQYLP